MKRRAVLCVVPLLVAGCASRSEPGAAESSPVPAPVPTDARAPLATAWDALRSGRYRVRMTVDSAQYGVYRADAIVDVDADATHVVTGFENDQDELITLGDALLVQSEKSLKDAPNVPPGTKWVHLDGKRIAGYAPKASEFAALADRVGGGASQPYWSGPREIKGRLDTGKVRLGALTNSSGDLAGLVIGPPNDTMRIPFTATVDPRGRIATIDWDLSTSIRPIAVSVAFTFSEYGTAAIPDLPPPSTVITAPEEVYREMQENLRK